MAINMGKSPQASINVTPMIDVLLVLLIIFMAIAPQKPLGIDALLPREAAANSPAQPENSIVLQIAADKTLLINSQAVTETNLHHRLVDIFSKRADRILFVQADRDLEFQTIARALDVAHGAGIDRVALDTAGNSPYRVN